MRFLDLLGLLYEAIMDRKGISRGVRISDAHALCVQGILLCKKLSNKQSGIRPLRLIKDISSGEVIGRPCI